MKKDCVIIQRGTVSTVQLGIMDELPILKVIHVGLNAVKTVLERNVIKTLVCVSVNLDGLILDALVFVLGDAQAVKDMKMAFVHHVSQVILVTHVIKSVHIPVKVGQCQVYQPVSNALDTVSMVVFQVFMEAGVMKPAVETVMVAAVIKLLADVL